jgi:hypothetical protein
VAIGPGFEPGTSMSANFDTRVSMEATACGEWGGITCNTVDVNK